MFSGLLSSVHRKALGGTAAHLSPTEASSTPNPNPGFGGHGSPALPKPPCRCHVTPADNRDGRRIGGGEASLYSDLSFLPTPPLPVRLISCLFLAFDLLFGTKLIAFFFFLLVQVTVWYHLQRPNVWKRNRMTPHNLLASASD